LPPVDFTQIARLDFAEPDTERFGCLRLALDAGKAGGTMPAVLNAANEVAVAAFLAGECGFLDIERAVESALAAHDREQLESVEQIEVVDAWAREQTVRTLAEVR
jgi:1-deoxy-D-xylulose-5-phosphate reductoisomerase